MSVDPALPAIVSAGEEAYTKERRWHLGGLSFALLKD